jgi:hypothetical protein
VADRIHASSSASSTHPPSLNYTDAERAVDPVGEEFFNILLELEFRIFLRQALAHLLNNDRGFVRAL